MSNIVCVILLGLIEGITEFSWAAASHASPLLAGFLGLYRPLAERVHSSGIAQGVFRSGLPRRRRQRPYGLALGYRLRSWRSEPSFWPCVGLAQAARPHRCGTGAARDAGNDAPRRIISVGCDRRRCFRRATGRTCGTPAAIVSGHWRSNSSVAAPPPACPASLAACIAFVTIPVSIALHGSIWPSTCFRRVCFGADRGDSWLLP
jgi:hypothetical protein